LVKRESDLTGS